MKENMGTSIKLLKIYKNILKEFISQTIGANKTIETLKSRFKNRFLYHLKSVYINHTIIL